ncbi:hypothetical protein NIES4101_28240 (plasmid) [Calothrix sp. NIES-4101]|nr:hypothetical protein NIES4101_28240 [Calothrix sp. NIES-4101]
MDTQLWIAYGIPQLFPEFVNPRVTTDVYKGKLIYIIEIYVNHPMFSRCVTPDSKAKLYLKGSGFLRPKRIYQGLHSEIFLDNTSYPPRLSCLTFDLKIE